MLIETVNRANLHSHLVRYELDMVGKTLVDTLDVIDYRKAFPMSIVQYEAFKSYAIPLIKKTLKINKGKAVKVFDDFYTDYGLRIKKYR